MPNSLRRLRRHRPAPRQSPRRRLHTCRCRDEQRQERAFFVVVDLAGAAVAPTVYERATTRAAPPPTAAYRRRLRRPLRQPLQLPTVAVAARLSEKVAPSAAAPGKATLRRRAPFQCDQSERGRLRYVISACRRVATTNYSSSTSTRAPVVGGRARQSFAEHDASPCSSQARHSRIRRALTLPKARTGDGGRTNGMTPEAPRIDVVSGDNKTPWHLDRDTEGH